MVANRLQKGLINSCIATRAPMVNCQNIFFQMRTHISFRNSERFYSENNNVSQVCIYILT
jgi:hypothetical protein